jgi:hypothetical protein
VAGAIDLTDGHNLSPDEPVVALNGALPNKACTRPLDDLTRAVKRDKTDKWVETNL